MSQTQNQQQPQQQSTVLATVSKWLDQKRDDFSGMLPQHMSVTRFYKIALNCIQKTPLLQRCSPSSLFSAITTAAELGLDPGGALGEAYLVPYGENCTLIIGYKGFIRLARQSGELASIEAHVVHEADKFTVKYGLNPVLEHEPVINRDPGKPTLVYCLAKFKDGSHHVEVMTMAQVEAIRARSRSGQNGPWKTDYEEMAKKTVVRRAAKYLPLSSEKWQAAVERDNEDFVDGEVVSDMKASATSEAPAAKGNERAKKALQAKGMKVIEANASESVDEAIARDQQRAALPVGDERAEPPDNA